MARINGGPTWDELSDDAKIRLDKVFRLLLMARNRRLAREAKA